MQMTIAFAAREFADTHLQCGLGIWTPIISKNESPCRKRSPAKGVWQKSDEKSDKSVRKSDQKVTESVPKTKKSDRTPFADLLSGTLNET